MLPAAAKAMGKMLKNFKRKSKQDHPIHLTMSDNGPEMKNKTMAAFMKKHDIKHNFGIAARPENQAIIERFNGTIMKLVNRFSMANNETKITQTMLNQELHAYNNSYNRVTKFSPIDALKPENHEAVLKNTQKNQRMDFQEKTDVVVGDKVRLAIIKDNYIF